MNDVVALLLDDAMPPERLGALLLAARKRQLRSSVRAADEAAEIFVNANAAAGATVIAPTSATHPAAAARRL